MGNFDQLFKEAQRAIASVAGVTITYSRGASSVVLTAVPAVTNLDADGDQIISEYTTRDFIVPAEDLVLNGSPIEPKRGDTIDETVGTSTHTYMVMRPDGGKEQPWRWTDTGRSTYRIHTNLKGIA